MPRRELVYEEMTAGQEFTIHLLHARAVAKQCCAPWPFLLAADQKTGDGGAPRRAPCGIREWIGLSA